MVMLKLKKWGVVIILIIACIKSSAQDNGIKFEKKLSWIQIVEKAKAEHKYIFMDCYATWCAPCKWMSSNIFPEKEVGDFYNNHFINVAVQMDKTPHDEQDVKDWYSEVDSINNKYHIGAYPSYLFFDSDGNIVHRILGAVDEPKEFINKGMDALNPEKQYYTIVKNCGLHKTDSVFLKQTLMNAISQSDAENAALIGDYYINIFKNPVGNADNIRLIRRIIELNYDKKYVTGFNLFLQNARQIDSIIGFNAYAEQTIAGYIFQDDVLPAFTKSPQGTVYWDKIKSNLKQKFPTLSPGLIVAEEYSFQNYIAYQIKQYLSNDSAKSIDWNKAFVHFKGKYIGYNIDTIFIERKTKYYRDKKMWPECTQAAYEWIHKYGSGIGERDMDNIVWDLIFMHATDKPILEEGAKWIKLIVDKRHIPNETDTYANLLYKLGRTEEAINWENKAIALLSNSTKKYELKNLKEFEASLAKMKTGVPTWAAPTNDTAKN